jgi:hypothetical protein
MKVEGFNEAGFPYARGMRENSVTATGSNEPRGRK